MFFSHLTRALTEMASEGYRRCDSAAGGTHIYDLPREMREEIITRVGRFGEVEWRQTCKQGLVEYPGHHRIIGHVIDSEENYYLCNNFVFHKASECTLVSETNRVLRTLADRLHPADKITIKVYFEMCMMVPDELRPMIRGMRPGSPFVCMLRQMCEEEDDYISEDLVHDITTHLPFQFERIEIKDLVDIKNLKGFKEFFINELYKLYHYGTGAEFNADLYENAREEFEHEIAPQQEELLYPLIVPMRRSIVIRRA